MPIPARALLGLLSLLGLLAGGCSPGTGSTGSDPTAATSPGGSRPRLERRTVVFNAEGNNLHAYEPAPPFTSQQVTTANHSFNGAPSDPAGWDINGQICSVGVFGSRYLIAGEDTGQPEVTPGWGVFELSGDRVGVLSVRKVGKLVPTYQPSPDGPDNYGCGVLSDGRVVTTDIGNDAAGEANGQLVVWFPPFDVPDVAFCKIDTHLATGQSIAVDADDHVFVASPRPSDDPAATAAGVWRYDGPFPTAADASGGCGRTDELGSPLADTVRKERVLAAGEHGLLSPTGVALAPDGHRFVSSVITGTINEYDAGWGYLRTVLAPPAGEELGDRPYSTGTPLGIGVGPDGSLYYADIGIVRGGAAGFGPGVRTGSVRRIAFVDGAPQPPETMADGLQFPDGIGVVTLGR